MDALECEVRCHEKRHVGRSRSCRLQKSRTVLIFAGAVDPGCRRPFAAPYRDREIRDDISPEDLLRALIGMCYMHDQPGWQTSVLRLVDVFIDGPRIRPGRSRTTTKKRK